MVPSAVFFVLAAALLSRQACACAAARPPRWSSARPC